MTDFKKYDTFATTIYLVRLAMDAKVFKNEDRKNPGQTIEDVVLTFCDASRIEGTEQLWVDARVARYIAERCKGLLKGDHVQIRGKLRFRRDKEGNLRGKMYDVDVDSFVSTRARAMEAHEVPPAAIPVFEHESQDPLSFE